MKYLYMLTIFFICKINSIVKMLRKIKLFGSPFIDEVNVCTRYCGKVSYSALQYRVLVFKSLRSYGKTGEETCS